MKQDLKTEDDDFGRPGEAPWKEKVLLDILRHCTRDFWSQLIFGKMHTFQGISRLGMCSFPHSHQSSFRKADNYSMLDTFPP